MAADPHAWWTVIPPALGFAGRLLSVFLDWQKERRRRRLAASEQQQLEQLTDRVRRLEQEARDAEAVPEPTEDDPTDRKRLR